MKKENEVKGKQLEQVVGGNEDGAIYNDGATNPISGGALQGGAIYNDGAALNNKDISTPGLGKSGALAPNEGPNGGALYIIGTDTAGIGGGGKK